MSDSSIGKEHLFLIYGIISYVVNGNESCVDIQIYDLEKAFDALWLEECLNDVYNTLPVCKRDDKIALLYESNNEN